MISRLDAIAFLNEKIENKNIIKHMLALEALMGGIYDALLEKGKTDLNGSKEEYMLAGLLHDGDYSETVPQEKQGMQITLWLKEKGFEIPDNVAHAMAAHNWHLTNVEPKSLMDWTIFCGDSLTGLIVACALVLPTRKLQDVSTEMVMKKFNNKAFAAGTRREEIALCDEKLGIPLNEFMAISLKSMQDIHESMGL